MSFLMSKWKFFGGTGWDCEKAGKKNPETVVPGLIHTNEEGGGDIVTCCKYIR
jgi:hypothetical protein